MQELTSLETSALIDLMASYTSEYTKSLNEGAITQDLEKLKLTINAIQSEILSRRQNSNNTTTTDPDIILPDN